MKNKQIGFTLIELMIVVAIIGILASVALPSYQTYTKRAKFTEVVLAATPFKTAIEISVQSGRVTALTGMDNGVFGIPAAAGASGVVTSVKVDEGVITATGTAAVDSATFILTPGGFEAPITWSQSGTCADVGLC